MIGERIVPHGADPLPWELLDAIDGVYFTGGDEGALRAARRAGALVATPRADATLLAAGVRARRARAQRPRPRRAARPGAARPGAALRRHDARAGAAGAGRRPTARAAAWEAGRRCPGRRRDAYGAGDSFAAALAYGLGDGRGIDGACALAARAGAHKLAGRAPFENQLSEPD